MASNQLSTSQQRLSKYQHPTNLIFQIVAFVRLLVLAASQTKLSDYVISGLFSVTIRQALFIAPCSHTFHYKCIRPLIEAHHPSFSCPLCRTYADLEDDVEIELQFEEEEDHAAAAAQADGDIPHLSKQNLDRGTNGLHGDVDDDDDDDEGAGIDIDVIDANSFEGQNYQTRSNSRQGPRIGENGLGGAETEVEGDGPGYIMRTTRGLRRGGGAFSSSRNGAAGSPLNADLTDEADELMAIDHASQVRLDDMGMYVDGGGEGREMIDVDATVGAKRKR
jgi:hypothetical protein